MKIGILTFWQTRDNYGQVLQAWALQYVLKGMGHYPFLIRYTHSQVLHLNLWKDLKRFVKNLIFLKWFDLFPKRGILGVETDIEKKRDFQNFKESYLQLSNYIYTSLKELKNNPPIADCYIVGSDQVWSKTLDYKENQAFFLNFGTSKIKRVAYAASFAMKTYPKQCKRKLKKMLFLFDGISVREKSGQDICKSVGYDATIVLDPTLLISSMDYIDFFSLKNKLVEKEYIFIYSINISNKKELAWDYVKKYSQQENLRIVVTPSSGYIQGKELFDGVDYAYTTIIEWMKYIYNATLVVTPSFHGIVFSILFHKQFVYIPLQGTFSVGNNRVLDLLHLLGLEDRILNNFDDFNQVISSKIDWNNVDNLLSFHRNNSLNFLKKYI